MEHLIFEIMTDLCLLILILVLFIKYNKSKKEIENLNKKIFKLQKGISEMYDDIKKLIGE